MEQRRDKDCRIFDPRNYGPIKKSKEDLSSCKECPWNKTNPHSLRWREYSKKIMGDKPHACHMKTKDVWGKKSDISEILCQGHAKIKEQHES